MSKVFTITRRTLLADTNMVGNVYFERFIAWQGACREEWLTAYAPRFLAGMGGQITSATVSCSCEYLAEAYVNQVVATRMTCPAAYFNVLELEFEQARVDVNPEVILARGRQKVVAVAHTAEGMVPDAWPSEVIDGLVAFDVDIRRVYQDPPVQDRAVQDPAVTVQRGG
jgi:enediyne core biosynthesis thioesterase